MPPKNVCLLTTAVAVLAGCTGVPSSPDDSLSPGPKPMVTDGSLSAIGHPPYSNDLVLLDLWSGDVRRLNQDVVGAPLFLDGGSILVSGTNRTVRLSLEDGSITGQRDGHIIAVYNASHLLEVENFTRLFRSTWEEQGDLIFETQPGCRVQSEGGINASAVVVSQQCDVRNYQDHDAWQILFLGADNVTEGPAGSSPTLGATGKIAYLTSEGIVVAGSGGSVSAVVVPASEDTRLRLPVLAGSDGLYFLREELEYRRVGGVHEERWTPVHYEIVKYSLHDDAEKVLVSVSKQYRIGNFDVAGDESSLIMLIQ